ncbi:MAG TPA: hypothetical protein VGC65_02300 [Bacteroidia bacterium]|jgi:hypothetical protein
MNDELTDFKVTDKETFIEFIDLLRKDLAENPETWENKRLADFLKAFAAFTEDIQEYYDNSKMKIDSDQANWKTFADIFKGATMYKE